jgi:hypothetical protein
MTTNDHANVIERTVLQICGSVELPSTWAFSAPGDVGDAHRHAFGGTRLDMAQ